MARVLGLLALAVASCGAFNVSPLTEAVMNGKSVNALVTDVLHAARDENPAAMFLEQKSYRKETSVLHQGLALLKEMNQDIQAKADEAEKATKKCNKKKELAFVAASKKSNSTAESLRQARIELEQAESTVEAVQAALEKKSEAMSKKERIVKKQIAAATAQIAITSKQLVLIMEVTNRVKTMNASFHGEARNAFSDISHVFDMFHGIVFNLRLELKIEKKTLLTHQLQLSSGNKTLAADSITLSNATSKFEVTANKIENRSISLQEKFEAAQEDLAAIGIERDECVTLVKNESRTHEQSGEVIEYIIAYFRKLVGLDSTVVATTENGTAVNGSMSMNGSEVNSEANGTMLANSTGMQMGNASDNASSAPDVQSSAPDVQRTVDEATLGATFKKMASVIDGGASKVTWSPTGNAASRNTKMSPVVDNSIPKEGKPAVLGANKGTWSPSKVAAVVDGVDVVDERKVGIVGGKGTSPGSIPTPVLGANKGTWSPTKIGGLDVADERKVDGGKGTFPGSIPTPVLGANKGTWSPTKMMPVKERAPKQQELEEDEEEAGAIVSSKTASVQA